MFWNKKIKFENGVLPDLRSEEEKALDYQQSEIVASVSVPVWTKKKTFKSYPKRMQNGSGSCFPAGTMILMENLDYKPIEKIHIGEKVITHNGNIEEVLNISSRKWQGRIYKVKGIGLKEINVSPEHPFLVDKRWIKVEDLKKGMFLTIPKTSNIIKDKTDFSFERDPLFLYVLGLYLAEGSLDKYKVVFSLHKEEIDLFLKVQEFGKKYGANVTCNKRPPNGMSVSLMGKEWVDRFNSYGSKICNNKKIDNKLLTLSPELQKNILIGWLDGDGCYTDRSTIGVSTSEVLIRQMFDIAKRNNIRACIQNRIKKEDRLKSWNLVLSKGATSKLFNKKIIQTSKEKYFREDKDNFYIMIDSIKKTQAYSGGHIYNLEVNNDNSYIVEGVAVHNCVIQGVEKERGIISKQKYGEFIIYSAILGYQGRENPSVGGSTYIDAVRSTNNGSIPEFFLPSQSLSDLQMMSLEVKQYHKDMAKVFGAKRVKTVKNIDIIASTLDATGKGIGLTVRFGPGEWFGKYQVKELLPAKEQVWGHYVVIVDYTLNDKGEKCLVIEDSACEDGYPVRLIPESFFKARTYWEPSYIVNFKTYVELGIVPERPKFDGTIISAQKCFAYENLFPANTDFVESWGPLTRKACILFQKKYNIFPAEGFFGKITKSKLEELYS